MKLRRAWTTGALLLALVAPAGAQGSTWYVDVSGTPPGQGTQANPYTSIDFAIKQLTTVSGDLILVAPGTYGERVMFNSKSVTVQSVAGPLATRIDAGGTGATVTFRGSDGGQMVLDGFVVTGGTGKAGIGPATAGGGVLALNAVFSVRNCAIGQNDAFWGGGLYARDSVGEVVDSFVQLNTGTGFMCLGAGLMVDGGSLLVESTLIESNWAGNPFMPGRGGGIYAANSPDLDVVECVIQDNIAELGGGGVHGPGEYVGCTIARNVAQFGGGVLATTGTVITDSLILDNVADSVGGTANFGGGVWGSATLDHCTIRANFAWGSAAGVDGGDGLAILTACDVVDNLAVSPLEDVGETAGGVVNALLEGCRVSGNVAYGQAFWTALGGGAAYSTLIDCEVSLNRVEPDPGFAGGGAFASELRRCSVWGNSSTGLGGGVFGGLLKRCDVTGNTADLGGGAAVANIERSTVCGNVANFGGGLYVLSSAGVTVHDSILWDDGDEIFVEPGGSVSVTYTDVMGSWPGVGNIDADPRFWRVAARDFHLVARSPCIDAGDPTSPPDPDGSRREMGAHRFDASYQQLMPPPVLKP